MYRRLKNFSDDVNQEDVYKHFIGMDLRDFFDVLTTTDLHPTLRLVAYLRAFGILDKADPSRWAFNLHTSQQNYKTLLETQYYQCRSVRFQNMDPLQPQEDGPFQKRHRLIQLEKQIQLDINRLFSNEEFFSNLDNRANIHLLTTLWSHINNDIYKQGIHEIVALCYQLAVNGVQANFLQHRQDSELFHLTHFTRASVMHLAFDLSTSIMSFVYPLYSDDQKMSQRMNQIQNQLLLKLDQPLNERINQLNLESVYLIRWLRLLFCREVRVEHVPRMWDFIVFSFEKTGSVDYLDYMVVSFYQQKRDELMRGDYNMVMKMFSGSLLGDIGIEGIQNVCLGALRLMGVGKQEETKTQIILKNTQKTKNSTINYWLSQQIKQGLKLNQNGNTEEGNQMITEVAELLEVLVPENETAFLDVLRSSGYESAIGKGRALEIVTQCLSKHKGWSE
ncbi:Rab-GTPase-TBC_domain-containing protein [Hexamita inflata]|uniref:Rab-GTPase-TBC_domain-containing protein n=1 Tax=Hexamita inflata TaxID=28002 RepID=A0ABP1HX05_9EUKA